MGTSSSNRGPKGRTDLLPSWYDGGGAPPPDGGPKEGAPPAGPDGKPAPPVQVPPQKTDDWKGAKGAITRYSKHTAGYAVRKAAGMYVRSLGGAGGARRSASGSIRAGSRLAGFLTSVASGGPGGGGLDRTLTDLGLSASVGTTSEETLTRLADMLAPEGSTNDEAIVRDAVLETLDTLYKSILDQDGDLSMLEQMTPAMIKEAVMEFVGNYIYKKWLYELGLAVEKNTVSEREAVMMEREVKDFIHAEVIESMRGKEVKDFSLDAPSNRDTIDKIFQLAYSTLEQ